MTHQQSEQLAVDWISAQRVVGAFIGSLIPDFHAAEDLLQRVAVAVVRKYAEYDPQRPFTSWAIGIAKYEVLAYRRQHATDRHLFDERLLETVADRYCRFGSEFSSVSQALRDCLQEVGGRARRALELRYAEDLKPARLAEELGMTDGAARVLLSRARAVIRECIQRRLAAAGDSA